MSTTQPQSVGMASQRAAQAGFSMSCDRDTGALLAVLAAAIPANGRVLELGTGTGVGTAWLVHGLGDRTDSEIVTVEIDPAIAALAAKNDWPEWVQLVVGDAVEVTRRAGTFDLIFADAQGGSGRPSTRRSPPFGPVDSLVDDMTPEQFMSEEHAEKTSQVREQLLGHPDLVSVEIGWSTGLILSTRQLG